MNVYKRIKKIVIILAIIATVPLSNAYSYVQYLDDFYRLVSQTKNYSKLTRQGFQQLITGDDVIKITRMIRSLPKTERVGVFIEIAQARKLIKPTEVLQYQHKFVKLANGDELLIAAIKNKTNLKVAYNTALKTATKVPSSLTKLKIAKWRKPRITPGGKVIPFKGNIDDGVTIINGHRASQMVKGTTRSGKKVSVWFDSNGFPIFKPKYETLIPDKFLKNGKKHTHFEAANKHIGKQLKANPNLKDEMGLTTAQVNHILRKSTPNNPPKGLTWHHHQDAGRMQLVDFGTHDAIKHTGGMVIWGK